MTKSTVLLLSVLICVAYVAMKNPGCPLGTPRKHSAGATRVDSKSLPGERFETLHLLYRTCGVFPAP